MRSVLLGMAVLIATPALAADPVTRVEGPFVVGEVDIDRPASAVRAFLSDAVRVESLSEEVVETRAEPDGPCQRIFRSVQGPWSLLEVVARRCETQQGFTETLVASEHFSAYELAWELDEVEGGTRLRYRVHTEPNLLVPQALIRSRTRSSVAALLRKVRDAIRK